MSHRASLYGPGSHVWVVELREDTELFACNMGIVHFNTGERPPAPALHGRPLPLLSVLFLGVSLGFLPSPFSYNLTLHTHLEFGIPEVFFF